MFRPDLVRRDQNSAGLTPVIGKATRSKGLGSAAENLLAVAKTICAVARVTRGPGGKPNWEELDRPYVGVHPQSATGRHPELALSG
jgi:hypothetical protein